jgi:uncharacterized protein YciI
MEFIYFLTLEERLIPEENWTNSDLDILERHFKHLVRLKEKGRLILAGKTAGQDKDTIGIVILKAKNFEEASQIIGQDPAVKEGIMKVKLQEYNIALFNQNYSK